MSRPTTPELAELINGLSFRTTAGFIQEAQRLDREAGVPIELATSIVLDAALMAAASFLQSAVSTGVVALAMPPEELLLTRLREVLALEVRVFPQREDGSFDPVGQSKH